MKKVVRLFLVSLLVLGLSACGEKKATLESDFEDHKSARTLIEDTVKELQKQDDVKELVYKSGDGDKGKASFNSGKSFIEIYVKDNKVSKISLTDKGKSDSNYSDDYIAAVNGSLKLSCFKLSTSNHNAIIKYFNNGGGEEENINGYIVLLKDGKLTINKVPDEALSKAIPITIDQIELVDFKCLPPNSIGTVYMQTQFKNNSTKTITSISYKYQFENDTHYLTCYDTLLPGDVSAVEDTFGPNSGNIADAQLLKVSLSLRNEDGSTTYVDYDSKTKEYSWW